MTDVTIIGAGISGLTAALVASEEGLSVTLIDKYGFTGSTKESPHIKALRIFNDFTPNYIHEMLAIEVSRRGIEVICDKVLSVTKIGNRFCTVGKNDKYYALCVIIAAGIANGITRPLNFYNIEIGEDCRASPAGLMLCGNARREEGFLACMADGIVCGENANEWVRSLRCL